MSREQRARWGVNERFVIGQPGNPMMERWRLVQTPWFGVYVHFIYREDLDPVPHDHPWNFWRLVIRGGYTEHYFESPETGGYERREQLRWRLSHFPIRHAHRIVLVRPGTVSVVIVGRKQRVWGFWTPERLYLMGRRTWVDYRDALGLRPTEGIAAKRPLGDDL